MTPVVAVEDLKRSFRRGPETIHALRGISFRLEAGTVTALVGPSGSGKSTVLNIISGWERVDTGAVVWNGRRDVKMMSLGWSEIGLIPQRLGLLEDLSVGENVELPLVLARRWEGDIRAVTDEILDHLDLGHLRERLPAETSLGEQQRTAIARGLVAAPRLILADEPTGNQDHLRERKILTSLRAAAAGGAACLVATHNRDVIHHCDRVISMHDGEIVSDETKQVESPWAPPRET